MSSQEDHSTTKGNYKTCLTLAGLLMEGLGRFGVIWHSSYLKDKPSIWVHMEEFSITGGARMGWFNATWPFAKLIVSADNLVLSVVFLGKYDFRPDDVISLERYGFIPLFQNGLRIVHSRSDYPPLVVFWTMGSRKKLLDRIRNIGFSPSAPASSTVKGGRTWPKPQRATRPSQ